MKKIIEVILFFIAASVSSQEYRLTLGNDILGMNLFTPIENARTINFLSTTPILFGTLLELDYSLFTNKQDKTRADKASIILKYPMDNFDLIKLVPSIGLTITGDLSGNSIGEALNKKIHNYFYSSLLMTRQTKLMQSNINSIIIYTNIYSEIIAITNYTLSARVGSSLVFYGNNFSVDLGYSYGYRYNFMDFQTLNYIKGLDNEGRINFAISAGNFRYDLNLLLDGNFSTGRYSITFGNPANGSKLTRIDIKVIPGSEYDPDSNKFLNSLQVELIPLERELSRIDFQLKSIYGWNQPGIISNETYYNRLVIGVNINLMENHNPYWINPLIGLGLGIENYHDYNIKNTTNIIPIYELRAGFNILLPQLFIEDNIQYGLNTVVIFKGSLNNTKLENNFILNFGIVIAIEI